MKKLTRIEAWKEIRKAFKPTGNLIFSNDEYNLRYSLRAWGLCNAVDILEWKEKISPRVLKFMRRDIFSARPLNAFSKSYFWPVSDKEARVKAISKILRRLRR
jgi:hypothetical protein